MIVAGKLYVVPDERDKFLDGHREIIKRSRAQAGCLDLVIVADPLEEGRINQPID